MLSVAVARVTAEASELSDKMIAMVESAARKNSLTTLSSCLLIALTLVFLAVSLSSACSGIYRRAAHRRGKSRESPRWWRCSNCLAPTTIGALLSAIGIAVPA